MNYRFFLGGLRKFEDEKELRICLLTDFIRRVFSLEDFFRKAPKRGVKWHTFKINAAYCMKDHLLDSCFEYRGDSLALPGLYAWFLGIKWEKSKNQLNISCHGRHLSVEQELDNLCDEISRLCRAQVAAVEKEWKFKLTLAYFQLSAKNSQAQAPLLSIMARCREHCPPGESGCEALKLSCSIFEFLIQLEPAECAYLLEVIPAELEAILQKCYEDISSGSGELLCLSYERLQFRLVKVMNNCLRFGSTTLDIKSCLIYGDFLADVIPADDSLCLPWILSQPHLLENCSRYEWRRIFTLPEFLLKRILNWAESLHERNCEWPRITTYCDNLRGFVDDEDRAVRAHLLNEHFHIVERLLELAWQIDVILKDKQQSEYTWTFFDLCDALECFHVIPGAWEKADAYFEVLARHFKKYAEKYAADEDFDLSFPNSQIEWFGVAAGDPQNFACLLRVSCGFSDDDFEMHLDMYKFLAKKFPGVAGLYAESLQNRQEMSALIEVSKAMTLAKRLDSKRLNERLEQWQQVRKGHEEEIFPGSAALIYYRNMAALDSDLPGSLNKILNLHERYEREYCSLCQLHEKKLLSESALVRLHKLKVMLEDKTAIERRRDEEIKRKYPQAFKQARCDALLEICNDICRTHWRKISDRPVKKWDADWRNALRLYFTTDANKRLLKQLMHHAAAGDSQWIYYHPQNQRFLESLGDDFESQAWLQPQNQCLQIKGQNFELLAEQNPMKIFYMGNYFDSCLSVGNFNSFSTIANAVEINKHVLWFKAGGDKVVGRKLIALSLTKKLFGFHSYGAAVGGEHENPWIKIYFDLYCLELARQCSVSLSNDREDGDELELFAQWYDDGIEKFDWWVLELQNNQHPEDIAASLQNRQKTKLGSNIRAALWLNSIGCELALRWKQTRLFKRNENACVDGGRRSKRLKNKKDS